MRVCDVCRVQGLYLVTSRELKRLDALAFSPIFQHYAESLNGLPTIRAFQRQQLFEAMNRVRGGRGGGHKGAEGLEGAGRGGGGQMNCRYGKTGCLLSHQIKELACRLGTSEE